MSDCKKCSKCGEVKSFDSFYKNKHCKLGLASECKECHRIVTSDWRKNNRNLDRSYSRKYASKNRADSVTRSKNWRLNNPDKVRVQRTKRRAIKFNQTHQLHNQQLEESLHQIRIRVFRCSGIKFEIDHIWPLSKGGPHHHDNLQLIPRSLNTSKLANMTFKHPSLLDWTDLPIHLLKWIKDNNPNQFKRAVKEWITSGQYTIDDFKNHLKSK